MPRLLCVLCFALCFTGLLHAENAPDYIELKGAGAVYIAHFSPDGKRILTGDSSTMFGFSIRTNWQLWDAESGKELAKMVGMFGGFASDGKKFAITSFDETSSAEITRIRDTESGKELRKLEGGFRKFSSDGTKIVTSGHVTVGYGETRIWDTASGKELHRLEGYFTNFSPDDKKVITVSDSIHIYDVESGKELKKLEGRFRDSHAYISHDGTKMVTSTGGGTSIRTVRIWDAESGEELHKFEGYSASVFFSLDMKKILVNTRGESRILDADSKKVLHKFEGTFSDDSPDGTKIVMTSQEGASVWDIESGQELLKLEHHHSIDAYFALEGRKIVTSHLHGGTERIWDVKSGKELKLQGGFPSFSPDGQTIMTRSDDGVHIWDAESGKELGRLGEGSEVAVSCAVFSPDGKKIVTSIGTLSEEEDSPQLSYTVRIWDLSTTFTEPPSEEGEK